MISKMKVGKKEKNQIMLNYIKAYMANDICPKKGELHVSKNSAFKNYKNPIEKLSEQFNIQFAVNGDYSNIKLPDMKIKYCENNLKITNN